MASKKELYVVLAYRWGENDGHCYLVGVFIRKVAAEKAAEAEEQFRGGKYSCEIIETTFNQLSSEREAGYFKIIKKRVDYFKLQEAGKCI